MHTSRRQINDIRRQLQAAKPLENDDKLPPQPSILPPNLPPGDTFLVRNARRAERLAKPLSAVKKRLSYVRPRNMKNRRLNTPAQRLSGLSFKTYSTPEVSIIIPVFNKFDLTQQCLLSLRDNISSDIAYQVIVVDNDSSDDSQLYGSVPGITYLRNSTNKGFVEGCDIGAAQASGDFLVFLNNDALITENWLESLLHTIRTYPKAGLVGSKILYLDGRLQEAGGVIFSNGDGYNYGKNDHPDRYQYNYVRDVDYCSGASIIISRRSFEKLGGFDMHYAPAYYEDTDLAFKVRQAGLRVIYQPLSVIYHIEGATSGTDISSGFKKFQAINHDKFVANWKSILTKKHLPNDMLYKARDRSGDKMILIMDELVPTPDKDAGSLRMVRLITLLQRLGYKVTFYPNYTAYTPGYTTALQQQGVEVVYGPIRFDTFLEQYGKYYDAVMLSRPRIASYYIDLCQAFCPKATIIYDTVDLHYLRLRRQAAYETGKLRNYYLEMADKHEILEKHLMHEADVTLVVSSVEAEMLKKDGFATQILTNIHTAVPAAYSATFDDRTDLLFVGGFAHLPNIDAIRWFVDHIFPKVLRHNHSIKLHVVGSEMPDHLANHLKTKSNVIVDGFLSDEDLAGLMKRTRIFVAPLRYGAGVKGKVGHAIEYGIPVVSTKIGLEGMHLQSGVSCVEADAEADFAAGIIQLYNNETQWLSIQSHALTVLDKYFSETAAIDSLHTILASH